MGDWIRAHRARLGLSRREAVRAGAVPPAPLTPTLLADFECGDRLPTLARLPALGQALRVTPCELADWILLAPRLEEALAEPEGVGPVSPSRSTLRAWVAAGRHDLAIAGAERTARTARGEPAQELALVQAASLVRVGARRLAASLAQRVLDRPASPEVALAARVVLAEAALAEGHRALARAWLGHWDRSGRPGAGDEALALRLEWLAVELGGAGRELRARRLTGLAARAWRAGQPDLARRAEAAACSARRPVRGAGPSRRPLAREQSSD
jgi:hypothetical protein